jgi:group I intron endonuclease
LAVSLPIYYKAITKGGDFMAYKVYAHIFPNGKRYVGLTMQNPKRRWREGKAYTANARLTNAIKKHGWENIQHVILADGLTAEEAEKMERRLIKEWDLLNPDKGYNNAPGGSHPEHTPETRKKIGQKSIGRHHSEEFKRWISEKNSGSGNYMYGKHHSEETKRKISEAKKGTPGVNKGKYGSKNPRARAVFAIDPKTGEIVARYGAISDAAELTNGCL